MSVWMNWRSGKNVNVPSDRQSCTSASCIWTSIYYYCLFYWLIDKLFPSCGTTTLKWNHRSSPFIGLLFLRVPQDALLQRLCIVHFSLFPSFRRLMSLSATIDDDYKPCCPFLWHWACGVATQTILQQVLTGRFFDRNGWLPLSSRSCNPLRVPVVCRMSLTLKAHVAHSIISPIDIGIS